jgi:hypothetical protein
MTEYTPTPFAGRRAARRLIRIIRRLWGSWRRRRQKSANNTT